MKKFLITSILAALFTAGTAVVAQDNNQEYLGLPGDNLNLYAVMKLFQESKTLEEFERSLNDEKNNINNLDLNGDGLVDYIRVIDNVDGDVHNIVLQVAVSERENQDVAVFTVQRFNNGQVQIQLTGDEELYGRDYIIEPRYDNSEIPNPGYTGNTYVRTTTVEVAAWPLVRFVYLPSYTIWHSSWYWGYYPTYWHTWRSYSWHYYYGYHYNWYNDYYGHYRRWQYHRYSRWNDFYYRGTRSYSPEVNHRIQTGTYKATYSHPEQRQEGEATFAKMHPDQIRRSAVKPSGNASTSTRRSTTTVTGRSSVNPSNGNNATTTRRSGTTVTNKSVTNPPSERSTVTTRKSGTSVTNKAVSNPSMEKNTVTSRKSPATVTNKSAVNPSSGQNARTNRSANQSKSTVVNSSNRRVKSEKAIKKDNKKKDSDNKESTRR